MMLLSNINYPEYYLCWLTWEAIDQTSHKLVYNTFQTYHSSIQYFNLCDYIGHNWFDKLITYFNAYSHIKLVTMESYGSESPDFPN